LDLDLGLVEDLPISCFLCLKASAKEGFSPWKPVALKEGVKSSSIAALPVVYLGASVPKNTGLGYW